MANTYNNENVAKPIRLAKATGTLPQSAAVAKFTVTGRVLIIDIGGGGVRRGKPDSTQAEIVDALRLCGCLVHITSMVGDGYPDIAVGRQGRTYLLELKTRVGRLSPVQRKWHQLWRGHVAVARSVEEALAAVGIETEG